MLAHTQRLLIYTTNAFDFPKFYDAIDTRIITPDSQTCE